MEAQKEKGRVNTALQNGGVTEGNITAGAGNVNLLPYAEKYLGIGFPVIPVQTKTKVPFAPWKEFQTSLPTMAWWKDTVKKYPHAAFEMIGLVTGKHSGVIELDFDAPSAVSWFEATVCKLPQTIISKTGRLEGGWGHFYRYPIGIDYVKTCAGVAENIDVRGDGGLAYLPPSLHKSGKRYGWTNIDPTKDGLNDLLELPKEAFEFLEAKGIFSRNGQTSGTPQKNDNKPGWISELLFGVKKGRRNNSAAKLAGWYLRAFNGDVDETRACLNVWNERNTPPLENAELKKVLKSIASRQGIDNLSKQVGCMIYCIEELKYPDDVTLYNIYVEGKDHPVQMTAKDIVTPRLFREKFVTLTRKLIPDIKNKDWFPMMEKALKDADEIQMSEDETPIGAIKKVIREDINRGVFDKPEDFVENQVVLYEGRIFLKLEVIARYLQYTAFRNTGQKVVGGLLRKIGFVNESTTLNGEKDRYWYMPEADFENE